MIKGDSKRPAITVPIRPPSRHENDMKRMAARSGSQVKGCSFNRRLGLGTDEDVRNFVFGHNMSKRCMYANQKETLA